MYNNEKNNSVYTNILFLDIYRMYQFLTNYQYQFFVMKKKKEKACQFEFLHGFLINYTCAKYKVTFFIKHFLILPIFHEGSTSINLDYLIKEDF